MRTKSKSLSILAAAAAMLATAIPARAAEVAYSGMTAAFDLTTTGTNTTGVIPLDPSGVFDGAYDFNGGDPIVTTRYYSGRFTTTYAHPAWASGSNAVTVNFYRGDGTTVLGRFGILDGGWGNIVAKFPDVETPLNSVATTPITLDYQIKLTSKEYGQYEIKIFTGPSATALTEGTAVYTGGGNGNFTPLGWGPLSFVSFSTTGEIEGSASSSNFKSSDAWIPGEVVAGVVSDPYFTPVAGTYPAAQSVSIVTNTPGATIHYTLDGSPPTTGSATYSGPLTVSASTTIKALAVKLGDTDSGIAEATYTLKAATPVPDVPGGTYNSKSQTITLSSATPGAVVYYTLNGDTPDNTSTEYTAPIVVSDDVTISAIAYAGVFDPSNVWVGNYVFQVQTPVFSPSGGTYPDTQNVTITSNPGTAAIYYTTNGTDPDNIGNGTLYTTPVVVSATTTLKAIAYQTGYLPSLVASDTYIIAPLPLGISYESKTTPFTVSATDLINGLTPVVVGTNDSAGNQSWVREGNVGESALSDGTYTGRATVGMSPTATRADTDNAGGVDIIWNFDTPQDISRLALYFSWGDGGRDNAPVVQIYASTSEYVLTEGPVPADGEFCTAAVDAGVAANGGFTLLGTTVDTAPSIGNNIKVNVMPLAPGNLATGVRSLYIRFGAAENDWVGCNEIDVFGTAPPVTNDYASWASANGVTGGVNGDSDNDGIKNLVEYALADGTSGTYTGGTLSFTKRGGLYGTDITYAIEESTDLSFWTPAASTQNAATISYVFTGPVPAKKFARLKVTQP